MADSSHNQGVVMKRILKLIVAPALLLAATYVLAADNPYEQRIVAIRLQKETTLKSEHGILSFVGSYRLKEGDNRVGSTATDEIPLPSGSAPAQVGKFVVSNGHVTFTSFEAGTVTLEGSAVSTVELTSADAHAPRKLAVGRLLLLYSGNDREHTVFVSDPQSPNRANFGGLDWYPINSEWRIAGKFVAYPGNQSIVYENALGGSNHADSPGYVVFTRNGHEYRLEVEGGPHGLTALFSDETNGQTTFGGGRSLEIEKGDGDAVTLDFNQAVNKPCAVNPYTACSLSPRQNHLALQVAAGERTPRTRVARVATAPKRIQ
jgi:uncharacterized protein (DUF1684 family)